MSPAYSGDIRKMSNISVFSEQYEHPIQNDADQRRYSAQTQYGWCAAGDDSDTRRSSCTRSDDYLSVVFRNALHVAIQHSSLDVLNLMLSCGVDPNQPGVNFCDGSRRSSSISDIALARDRKDVRFQLSSRLVKRRNASQDSSSDEKHLRRRQSKHSSGSEVAASSAMTSHLAGTSDNASGTQTHPYHMDDLPTTEGECSVHRAAIRPNGQLIVIGSRDREYPEAAYREEIGQSGYPPGVTESATVRIGLDNNEPTTQPVGIRNSNPELKPLNVPDITIDGYSTPSSPTATPSGVGSPTAPGWSPERAFRAGAHALPSPPPEAPHCACSIESRPTQAASPKSTSTSPSIAEQTSTSHVTRRHVCHFGAAAQTTSSSSSNQPIIEEDEFDFAATYTANYVQTLPPIYLGVADRKSTAVRLLLRYGASPHVIDAYGCTPLHLSASTDFQSWDCAVALIEHGARIHVTNRYGVSPCHLSPDLRTEQERLLRAQLGQLGRSTRELLDRKHVTADKGSVLNLFSLNEFHDIAARIFQKRRKSEQSAVGTH